MKIRYRVHSANVEKITQSATLAGGQTVNALVDGMTVELVEVDGADTLTRRFVPDDMDAAKSLFKTGAILVATITKEKA